MWESSDLLWLEDGVMGWWTAGLIPAGEPGADRFLWDIGQP